MMIKFAHFCLKFSLLALKFLLVFTLYLQSVKTVALIGLNQFSISISNSNATEPFQLESHQSMYALILRVCFTIMSSTLICCSILTSAITTITYLWIQEKSNTKEFSYHFITNNLALMILVFVNNLSFTNYSSDGKIFKDDLVILMISSLIQYTIYCFGLLGFFALMFKRFGVSWLFPHRNNTEEKRVDFNIHDNFELKLIEIHADSLIVSLWAISALNYKDFIYKDHLFENVCYSSLCLVLVLSFIPFNLFNIKTILALVNSSFQSKCLGNYIRKV